MSCGHVGCCDDSPNRHASAHARSERHPIIQSYEPGEDWWYCYFDDLAFDFRENLEREARTNGLIPSSFA
jgi:uncharacterized UBP type Zn finger protein